MSLPLVSVITAVYNGSLYIEETIKSILNQTITDFEYIIIDDASTDDSVDRIMGFSDPRIKLVKNMTNSRLVKTRNRGLDLAQGRYIALLDHDDVAYTNRLELQYKFLEERPEFIMVGAQAENIDEAGRLLGSRITRKDSPEQLKARLLFRNPFVNSTLFFRRNATEPMKYRSEFPLSEDYDFIVRIADLGKIYILPQPLLKYRLHSNNYSHLASEDVLNFAREIKRNQLNKICCSYSEDELTLHSLIEHFAPSPDKIDLKMYSNWIRKLLSTNIFEANYSRQSFNDIACDELTSIGEHCAKSGSSNIADYFSFEFLMAFKKNPIAAFRIFAKLALRPYKNL